MASSWPSAANAIASTCTAATGKTVMIYGQTEVTLDLMNARKAAGLATIYQAADVTPHDFDTDRPRVSYVKDGVSHEIDCDFIAGCDGFHGVSRASVQAFGDRDLRTRLPVRLARNPVGDAAGLARTDLYQPRQADFRSARCARCTAAAITCNAASTTTSTSGRTTRFWDELKRRLDREAVDNLVTGPSIEKSIAPLRSFVAEPMRFGRMFLAGDAAHIVPPTGAKGLNLAASDVHYLSHALREYYDEKSSAGIDGYSQKALARVWKAVRFSWWMTSMLHKFPDEGEFGARIQLAELDYLVNSKAASAALSENYVGLPY